ncbi:hypothetical protein LC612_29525 [Nostoc sp. CHAB 5834]|nr:hypothetical protein [Nostoc sp. CHAB 5834]
MQLTDIVDFWRGKQQVDSNGRWSHRLDAKDLSNRPHSFNLDYPVSPYIGDVLAAPIIILNANAGYRRDITDGEFPDKGSIDAYKNRVDNPSEGDWTSVSRYYDDTNYGHWIAYRQVVVVNACAYRSPKLSEEPDNAQIIPHLPSSVFMRRWLLEAVVPLSRDGERLIVVNRGGHWRLPSSFKSNTGVIADPFPRFPRIYRDQIAIMEAFLAICQNRL